MTIRNVLILLAVVGALLGAWWLSAQYPAPGFQATESSTPVESKGDLNHKEESDLYVINITYPDVANSVAAARVEEIVDEMVTGFKEGNIELIDAAEAARIREQDRRYEFSADYKEYKAGDFASYVFTVYLDTGGAHPNAFFRTVTFGEGGKEWELVDLFTANSSYLPTLSEEAYTRVLAELRSRTGGEVTPDMEEGVRMGTAPSPEALQFFYLSGSDLHLLFPPYQVAAYAAGSFDISIPLSELEDILKPEVQ